MEFGFYAAHGVWHGRGDGYQCGLDWGRSSIVKFSFIVV